MSDENGQVAVAEAEQVAAEAVAAEAAKPWLDPDALTPRDYLRGKQQLADVLKGRSPYELLQGEEMYPWLIWAIRSRTDPGYTWEQALDEPFWQFRIGGDAPGPLPAATGSGATAPAGPALTPKPARPTRGRSSGPSST
jgi:hypothetical protein